jgi:hypothetical protein
MPQIVSQRNTLEPDTLRTLKAQLWGSLILRAEPGYDEARSAWNAMIDRRPALVVRCLGAGTLPSC